MHELLSWAIRADSASSSGANNKDVLVAIVGVVGTLLVTGLTAIVASFRREKVPESTVESIENQANIRHEQAIAAQIQAMREDLDEANYIKDNNAQLYAKLREAVWSKGMNPDTLMADLQ